MTDRLCEVCDIPLMPDYEYDVCEPCIEILREAMKEPATRVLFDPDLDLDSDMVS
jgi:hypothetical protein